jgi:GDP-L-fucose synthase
MVGSAISRRLVQSGYINILGKTISELDLTRQEDVESYIFAEHPDVVILAAAKVGGILANNTYRAQFLYENLMIESNIIHAAHLAKVKKLIFLGSSCIYPKYAEQPLREEYLLHGKLEETNEPYAIAKIAGIKLCESYFQQYGSNFFSLMPTNLYGPFDNFDLQTSHVLPAFIRKFHEAKKNNAPEVEIWGTGNPFREFMYVEDLADAVVFLMQNTNAGQIYELGIPHINIGTGKDITIADLAALVQEIIGYEGGIYYNTAKPDGTPRKLLDVSRLHALGWQAKTSLPDGILKSYQWFLANRVEA